MAGLTSIINRSLIKLGADLINDINEVNSKNARIAANIYSQVRKEMLRAHPWNFAIRRRILASLTTTPAFGFGYEYQLPSDCLRIIRLRYSDIPYKVEQGKILCDESTLPLIYIADITDTEQWDPLFAEAYSTKLAAEMCLAVTGSASFVTELNRLYEQQLRGARLVDGQEDTADEIIYGTWIDERA